MRRGGGRVSDLQIRLSSRKQPKTRHSNPGNIVSALQTATSAANLLETTRVMVFTRISRNFTRGCTSKRRFARKRSKVDVITVFLWIRLSWIRLRVNFCIVLYNLETC